MEVKWNEMPSADYQRRPNFPPYGSSHIPTVGSSNISTLGDDNNRDIGNISARGHGNFRGPGKDSMDRVDPGEDVSDKRLAAAPNTTVFLKTREDKLQPKKFSTRCRLFVSNLSNINTEEEFKRLFEPFGEVSEVFLSAQEGYGLLKMDTKENACLAKASLDCSLINGKHIVCRFAAQCSSIRVKNLAPFVTNELLRYAFHFFGEIERSVVILDEQGHSIGEGIVSYTSKSAAKRALRRCTEGCYVLTGAPMPVIVEPYHENDEEVGLLEKTIPKRTNPLYQRDRNVKPHFAIPGSKEHEISIEWKRLYEVMRDKRMKLDMEFQAQKKILEEKMSVVKLGEQNIVERLKHLEEERELLQRQLEISNKEKDPNARPESYQSDEDSFSYGGSSGAGFGGEHSGPIPPPNFPGARGRGGPLAKRAPMEWRRGGVSNMKRGRYQY